MSQENVDIMRQGDDAFNRRDREAFLAGFDPDAEWHVTGLVVDQKSVYRGLEEIWSYVTVLDEQARRNCRPISKNSSMRGTKS